MKIIKSLDYFGYTPQFLISGETQYKSIPGGIIFIFFIIFSVYYLGTESINYISKIDDVKTSRSVSKISDKYNLTNKDIYFGIGLINTNQTELNLTLNFSYIDINVIIVKIDKYGNRTNQRIELEPCQLNSFISMVDLQMMPQEKIQDIQDRLLYYLCLPSNFNSSIASPSFGQGEQFILVNATFRNTSILKYAEKHLFDTKPKFKFIYRSLLFDSENKSFPYSSFIDSFYNDIDYVFVKRTEIFVNPFELADDINFLTGVKFTETNNSFSDQPNNTIFQISRNYDLVSYIYDRTITSSNQFVIYKLKLNLNPMLVKTLRSYQKFSSFLAGVTAILSNALLIFAIIMIQYNSIQGNNNIIQSMYNFESVKNMEYFSKDLKEIINRQNVDSNMINSNIV